MTSAFIKDDERALERRTGEADLRAAFVALRCLIGEIALEIGETPRSILEDEFKKAPADEFWRETLGAAP